MEEPDNIQNEEGKEKKSAKQSKDPKRKAKDTVSDAAVLRPLKLSKKELYKAPTVEELNQLKEAENLFHCSILKMQVRNHMPILLSHLVGTLSCSQHDMTVNSLYQCMRIWAL